jgi:hypothetical protein
MPRCSLGFMRHRLPTTRARVPLLAVALFAFACDKPIAAVPTTATATKDLTVCKHDTDEGDDAPMRGVVDAMKTRLTGAGYRLVDANCDIQLSFSFTTKTRDGDSGIRDATMVVRDGNAAFVDKIHMEFQQSDVPADEPDRLAILLVNALNVSAKVGALASGGVAPGTPSGPIAGSTWKFCGLDSTVTFNTDSTFAGSRLSCTSSNWVQTGDRLVFNCNDFTVWDVRVAGTRMSGEWHRVKEPEKAANHARTCLEKQ